MAFKISRAARRGLPRGDGDSRNRCSTCIQSSSDKGISITEFYEWIGITQTDLSYRYRSQISKASKNRISTRVLGSRSFLCLRDLATLEGEPDSETFSCWLPRAGALGQTPTSPDLILRTTYFFNGMNSRAPCIFDFSKRTVVSPSLRESGIRLRVAARRKAHCQTNRLDGAQVIRRTDSIR
jgi:hypothetical protein